MPSRLSHRRAPFALFGAMLTAAALGAATLVGAAPAFADQTGVDADTVVSTTATFEWAVNEEAQGRAANGACSYFVAGTADGTEATYASSDEDLVLIKRGIDDSALLVTKQNRCAEIEDGDGGQRALFTQGVATEHPDGTLTVQWQGAVTIYAYGGLVPWYVKDPTLTTAIDGTAKITAELGGYASSMDDPNGKTPLAPEYDQTILDLADVTIDGDDILATPRYGGVDYFALTDPFDEDSARQTTSAIPDEVKTSNPEWGSWPTDLVDFHYRTGLSSYWHSSGLTADPIKPPLPVRLSLSDETLDLQSFDPLAVASQPQPVSVTAGSDATFAVTSGGSSDRPVSYQWQRGTGSSTAANATWTDIEGATASTLTLSQTALDASGELYRAVLTNGAQRIRSSAAALTVTESTALHISWQPEDVDLFERSGVWLSTYADGEPAATSYQWQSSTDDGVTWQNYGEALPYGDVRLDDLSREQDGLKLRTIVSNGVEEVTSRVVTVRVRAADGPTIALFDGTTKGSPSVADGGPVWVYGGGFPQTSDTWAFGLVTAERWAARGDGISAADLISGGTMPSENYLVNGAWAPQALYVFDQLDLTKRYLAVVISGTPGDRSYDAAVPVSYPGQTDAAFTAQPTSLTVTAPAAASRSASATDPVATFEVGVTGTPVPVVTWQSRGSADDEWAAAGTGTTLAVAYTAEDDGLQLRALLDGVLASEVATLKVVAEETPGESGVPTEPGTTPPTGDGITPPATGSDTDASADGSPSTAAGLAQTGADAPLGALLAAFLLLVAGVAGLTLRRRSRA